MTERMQIIIEPPQSHPDFLTIQDAMEQILDYFQLASIGDEQNDSPDIVWKLVEISMQSPLTVTAEPTCFDPSVNINVIAKQRKDDFEKGIKQVLTGVTPDRWSSRDTGKIIDRILQRNKNGIGKTSIVTDFEKGALPIEITPQLADSAIAEIHKLPSRLFSEDLSHKELGSIDGYLIAVGSDHRQPAIQVKDRLTEKVVWCRVPEETRDAISSEMHLNDVWKHARVIVSGFISFEKNGDISRIYNAQISPIATRDILVDDIQDREFTDGMSAYEYLKKLREDNLG